MQSSEQIRARVEAADRLRADARADAATQVALDVGRRARALEDVANVEVTLAARLEAAASVMSVAELAEFTGIKEAVLRGLSGAPVKRSVRGKTRDVRPRKQRNAPSTDDMVDAVILPADHVAEPVDWVALKADGVEVVADESAVTEWVALEAERDQEPVRVS